MAMEKCPKLQKILEKDYRSNDVTIILILDNNELYIGKKYYNPGSDGSLNPKTRNPGE